MYNWGERSEAPLFWVVRNQMSWYVKTRWYVKTGWYCTSVVVCRGRAYHLHVTSQPLKPRHRILNPCRNRGTELLPGEAGLGELVHGSTGTTLLGAKCRLHSCTHCLHLQTLSQPTAVWFTYVGSTWTAYLCQECGCGPGRMAPLVHILSMHQKFQLTPTFLHAITHTHTHS